MKLRGFFLVFYLALALAFGPTVASAAMVSQVETRVAASELLTTDPAQGHLVLESAPLPEFRLSLRLEGVGESCFIDGPNRYRWNQNNPFSLADFDGQNPRALHQIRSMMNGRWTHQDAAEAASEVGEQALITGLNAVGVTGILIAGPVVIVETAAGAVVVGTADQLAAQLSGSEQGPLGALLGSLSELERAALFAALGGSAARGGSGWGTLAEIPGQFAAAIRHLPSRALGIYQGLRDFLLNCGAGGETALTTVPRFANRSLAQGHYMKHARGYIVRPKGVLKPYSPGPDVPEFTKASQYTSAARAFLGRPRVPGVLEGVRANGDLVRFQPSTGYFGIRTPGGVIRTFFRPRGDAAARMQYYRSQF